MNNHTKNMKDRPYIICHLMASLDGRIDCDMTEQIESGNQYYEALDELQCPSTLMGRVTMQMHYAEKELFNATDSTPLGKEAYSIALRNNGGYIIAIDTFGKLMWQTNQYDGKPLLVITSERCPQEYVERLSQQGISWIATGREGINLSRAMEILRQTFGVERLAVVGGGHINAAFLTAGLLDKVSMMFAPGIDGRAGMTAAFDGISNPDYPPTRLRFTSVRQMGDTVWVRYATK